jgi:hypothetical protein
MSSVSVEIELGEIDARDLLEELIERIGDDDTPSDVRGHIQGTIENIITANFEKIMDVKIKTLIDVQKMEHISTIWNKYTLQQMQNALPE